MKYLTIILAILLIPLIHSNTLEVSIDPEYPSQLLALDESVGLSYLLKNPSNSTSVNVELKGTALNLLEAEIVPFGINCQSKTSCSFSLNQNEEKIIRVKIEGVQIGNGDLIFSYTTDAEKQKIIEIKVIEELARGIYNAPGISWLNIFIILLLSTFYLFVTKRFSR